MIFHIHTFKQFRNDTLKHHILLCHCGCVKVFNRFGTWSKILKK